MREMRISGDRNLVSFRLFVQYLWLQWNFDLTKCQGTVAVSSLYGDFLTWKTLLEQSLRTKSQPMLITPPKADMFHNPYLKIPLFICPAWRAKLSKLIWTHDRDVRGMGPFSSLRHKLLKVCNAIFLWKQECKAVCEVKSIDPCLSHHGRGSKLPLVLPSLPGLHGTEKAKFWVTMLTYFLFLFWSLGALKVAPESSSVFVPGPRGPNVNKQFQAYQLQFMQPNTNKWHSSPVQYPCPVSQGCGPPFADLDPPENKRSFDLKNMKVKDKPTSLNPY